MMWSNEEIRKMIIEEKEEVTSNGTYLSDFTTGMTDGLLPVYYNQIIEDWKNMPMEWSEQGAELCNSESTITDRMTADLFCYYLEQVETELTKLLNEWEHETINN